MYVCELFGIKHTHIPLIHTHTHIHIKQVRMNKIPQTHHMEEIFPGTHVPHTHYYTHKHTHTHHIDKYSLAHTKSVGIFSNARQMCIM